MVLRNRNGALDCHERRVVKALLDDGWRNQDIQALINIGRSATINSARITEVKKDLMQVSANKEELEFYKIKKKSYDIITGLNLFDDERLIRAREAMILAVQIFNSAALKFKSEVFVVLVCIAWTYLLHEFYLRKGTKIIGKDGRSLLLSQMIERDDCPITSGIRNNLRSIKLIRDDVEHKLLGRADLKWQSLFQACCLNFDKVLCDLFGKQLTLANELRFALQFARMGIEQLSIVNKYEIPEDIEAMDGRLKGAYTEQELADLEYQFRVIYTLDAASKARSYFEFLRPDSPEGKEIRNVLVQYKTGDELYPYKPGQVCKLIADKTGKKFTMLNHTRAWQYFKIRPENGTKQLGNTNKDFCIYHAAHKDYTYSHAWVDKLILEIADEAKFSRFKEGGKQKSV